MKTPITSPTYSPTTSHVDMFDPIADHPCFNDKSFFNTSSSSYSDDTGFFHLPTDIAIVQRKRIGKRIHLRKPKKRKPKKPFVRRKLPYHLVMRCLRRRSNRPPRLTGPSRRDQRHTRQEKRRRYRRGRVAREHTAYFEQLLTTPRPSQQLFPLPEFDKDLLSSFVDDLDPTQSFRLCREFSLESPNSSFQDSLAALVSRQSEMYFIAAYPNYTSPQAYSGASISRGNRDTTPLVFDTGATNDLTPYRADFLDYQKVDLDVKAVGSVGKIVGFGTVLYRFKTRCGHCVYRPGLAYHMPSADIRLFSPQANIQVYGGSATLEGRMLTYTLPDGRLVDIELDNQSNLPLVHDFVCNSEEHRIEGTRFMNSHSLYYNQTVSFNQQQVGSGEGVNPVMFVGTCVTDETNQNLTGPQKELLHWHHKLCINMQDLQNLMKPTRYKDDDGRPVELPPVIPTIYASTRNCPHPMSLSGKLSKMKSQGAKTIVTKKVPSKEGVLSTEKYEPGDMISTDQFIVRTPGRKLNGYGREGKELCYSGGTLYADAASRLIQVEPQVSLGAGETVNGKAKFEDWIWSLAGVLAKHYHSDNGIFASQYFREDVLKKKQTQSFSGVGAQHQNAHAERDIQTISYWARSMMVHASIHWPADKADDIRLWAFAVKHAAWLYNRLPQKALGYRSPLEVFTKTKSDHRELLRAHVWGCPVFVLDPKLQDGKKLPKFNRRARMGQFVGFSDEHSSLVAKVRNLSTNFISPQFHVIFDDKFTTIQNDTKLEDTSLESIFTDLFDTCRDYYGEEPLESDSGKQFDELPELHDEWLNEAERREKKSRQEEKRARQVDIVNEQIADAEKLNNLYKPVYPVLPTDGPPDDSIPDAHAISDDESSVDSDDETVSSAGEDDPHFDAPEGVDLPPSPPDQPAVLRRSRRQRRKYNPTTDGLENHPDFIRGCTTSLVTRPMKHAKAYLKENKSQFALSLGPKQPPRRFRKHGRKRLAYQARLFRKKLQDANTTPHAMNWEVPTAEVLINSDLARFVHFAASDCGFDGSIESLTVNWLHPLMLAAKTSASAEDNPNWWQAMNGPFAEEYWQAACLEVMTLEDMDAWEVVDQTPEMNVLPSTWAFKCKRFPDGLIKKFKARFYARGDRQIEGVDYFETYAPVV